MSMSEVGLFLIGKPEKNNNQRKIINSLMDIVSDDFDNIAFCDSEDGLDKLYVFMDIQKQKEIFELFSKYNVLVSYKNVTKEFLYQKDLNPIFTDGDFKDTLYDFLRNNLDSDIVLDKINELGITSLNEIDYKVLQK